jgi:macrolide transport system ATP-binding/permease protein
MSGDSPLQSITLRIADGYLIEAAQRNVEQLLDSVHGKRDFFTMTNDQLTKTMRKTSESMTLLITAIAGISLLVGGVG